MTPIGPYRSPWASIPAYIIRDFTGAIRIVMEGNQPSTGTFSLNIREARAWLQDNGFVQK